LLTVDIVLYLNVKYEFEGEVMQTTLIDDDYSYKQKIK